MVGVEDSEGIWASLILLQCKGGGGGGGVVVSLGPHNGRLVGEKFWGLLREARGQEGRHD